MRCSPRVHVRPLSPGARLGILSVPSQVHRVVEADSPIVRHPAHPRSRPIILASVEDDRERLYLERALRDVAVCEFVANERRILGAVDRRQTGACLIDLTARDDRDYVDVIRRIRHLYGFLPIIGYCALDARGSQHLLTTARAGATHLLIRGYDNPVMVVRTALGDAGWQWATEEVMRQLGQWLPPQAQRVFAYIVAHADVALSVEQIAGALTLNRRTLGRQLRRAGLPGPEAVVSWCRLLVAAQLMTRPEWTMERAALALRFASTSALRAMIRRYCDLPATALRQPDGLERVSDAFRSTCEPAHVT
jgi:AraC-like DNA-binding protein